MSGTYLEFESETLKAIVGPFPSRDAASDWASRQDDASWQRARVLSPLEAEQQSALARERLDSWR